jgi:probable HAF family extracellular repeat protein
MNKNRFGARFFLGCFAIFLVSAFAQAAPPQRWSLVELGSGSRAWAINNRGDVAGGMFAPSGGYLQTHAFLWQNGFIQDLGASVGTPPGSATSIVLTMNDRGVLAGTVDGVATVWQDGVATSLGINTPMVSDINKSGTIVGTYLTGPIRFGGRFLPYIYQNGVLTTLGTLGGDEAHAEAINDHGVIAGWSYTNLGTRQTRALVYENGVMRDLGTLGGRDSMAFDINNHGVVVGMAEDASDGPVGFIYDDRGGMRALPQFFIPQAINDRGAMIGNISPFPYLYEDGMFTRLDTLPAVRAAGYTSIFPTAINDRGWITGYGTKAGSTQYSAFLLMPR